MAYIEERLDHARRGLGYLDYVGGAYPVGSGELESGAAPGQRYGGH